MALCRRKPGARWPRETPGRLAIPLRIQRPKIVGQPRRLPWIGLASLPYNVIFDCRSLFGAYVLRRSENKIMSTAVTEEKEAKTKLNQLEQIKKFTKVVADTADFESIKDFKPQDAK